MSVSREKLKTFDSGYVPQSSFQAKKKAEELKKKVRWTQWL